MSRIKLKNYILIIFILITFLIGLFFNENSSGGAKNDHTYALLNFNLFLLNDLKNIPWDIYSSSALPLFYLFLKFFFDQASKLNLVISNLSFAVFSIFIFYKLLIKKFDQSKLNKSYIILYSFLLLLSPYFRSSIFWGLEELIGILMLILTLYFFSLYKENNKLVYLILLIFFTSLAFYTRQSYLFLATFIFVQVFNFKNLKDKKNIIIIGLFLIFYLPSLYFFINWNGLLPPIAVDQGRKLSLFFFNIPIILSIFLIYLIPFMFLTFKNLNEFLFFFKKKIIFTFIISIIYFVLFTFSETHLIGGGAFKKILLLFNFNNYINFIFLSIIASISTSYIYYGLNNTLKIFIIFLVLVFLSIDIVFQEYFDPVIFVIISSLINFKKINTLQLKKFIYFSFFYYLIFLSGANLYYIYL